jgi:dihydroorotase
MSILIKQAKVICPSSQWHNHIVDILIEGGYITEIKKNIKITSSIKIIEAEGLHVSTGWLDMQAVSGDPGFEHIENLETLIESAASGGFTGICVHSNNNPQLHSKSQIDYILNTTKNKVVDVFPLGTVTQDAKGVDISEMNDMKLTGAIAFSDYKHSIAHAGVLMRALQYATNIDSLIITHCNDKTISAGGQMNESETSTALGLKGIPALAEEIMLERAISILEYTAAKIHIATISTKKSVELIKKAKSSGLKITCGVAAINLLLEDSCLKDFDTNYKLEPPLRTKKDIQALRLGIENKTIDVIVSDHSPQDTECKDLEFDLANVGIINLQTAFNCAFEALKEKNIEAIIANLSTNPRLILGLKNIEIKEKQEANLTLFTLHDNFILTQKNNTSKSKNSPFFDKKLSGKVLGIVNGTKNYFS